MREALSLTPSPRYAQKIHIAPRTDCNTFPVAYEVKNFPHMRMKAPCRFDREDTATNRVIREIVVDILLSWVEYAEAYRQCLQGPRLHRAKATKYTVVILRSCPCRLPTQDAIVI